MELPDNKRQAILEAIYGSQKIEAIKRVREATGCGLKEAKEFVETLSGELYKKEPQRFSSPPKSKSGCVGSMMVGTLILAGLLVMICR